jgi:hypothetical protein
LEELIDELTSRVPARLALGCDQLAATPFEVEPAPDGEVDAPVEAPADALDGVDAVVEADACVELLEDLWLLPPHAATTMLTSTNDATAKTARRDDALLMSPCLSAW